MSLRKFELEVLKIMLDGRLSAEKWNTLHSNCSISDYEYTTSGYFLKINSGQLGLKKEVISSPVVKGNSLDLVVGFVLYVETDHIIIECHSWGFENFPKNIRDLDFTIESDKKFE